MQAAAAAAARALRVNVTVAAAAAGDPPPHLLPPPQISCDQETVYFMENVFSMLILVGLVCLLNRGFEESYRLSFYISFLSARDRRKMQSMKNQADWLLHNIIPNHVTSKKTFTKALPQDYSENHRDIGVVFANLVNFNELGRMTEQNDAHQDVNIHSLIDTFSPLSFSGTVELQYLTNLTFSGGKTLHLNCPTSS